MLEKTVRSKVRIQARRSEFTVPYCVNQNFSRYWLFRTARNHKIPHYAKEPIPSKLTNTQGVERGYSIPNPHQKQKILKTIHFRKLYII